MKNALLLILLGLMASPAWATNYFDKNETCLKTSDVQKIAAHFTQFKNFVSSEELVCKGQGIDEKWFEVVRSVLAMERLTVTGQLQRDANDDFTLRPIGQKDWWAYFTERTHTFEVEPSYCNSNPNVVAYVYQFYRGKIHLCKRFFEMDPGSQIEVMMHEVRHFDGHSHVTCTQGSEIGNAGACDNNIKAGGSYAVSVQASVELSYVDQLSAADRVLSESSAIYSVNNKFNSLPTVKSSDYIYLANNAGELHRAPVANLAKTELVAKMKSPAKIYGNGSQLTVFPLDTKEPAYRASKDLKFEATSIGAFAVQYNSESEYERGLYQAVNYYGSGGIAKEDTIYAFCGTNSASLAAYNFPAGHVQSMLNLKLNSSVDTTYILSESGEVYDLKCNDRTGKMSSALTRTTLPRDTIAGFSIEQGSAYVLNDAGELSLVDLKTEVVNETTLPANDWISATPIKTYNIFEKSVE